MATVLNPQTVDGENLQWYSALEYLLLGDLRELLEEPLDADNRPWLLAVLETLLDVVSRQFHRDEADGYLAGVLEDCPYWWDDVQRLRHDYRRLITKLWELRGCLQRQEPVGEITDDLRERLREWMNEFTAHRRQEGNLLQQAVNVDLGGEG